jgi:hypothetical protein
VSLKNSNDTIGNRTRDLPVCSVVPYKAGVPNVKLYGSAQYNTRQTHVKFAKIFAKRTQFERLVYTIPRNRSDTLRSLQCKLDINECNKKYSRDRSIPSPCKLGLLFFWDYKRHGMVSFLTTFRHSLLVASSRLEGSF